MGDARRTRLSALSECRAGDTCSQILPSLLEVVSRPVLLLATYTDCSQISVSCIKCYTCFIREYYFHRDWPQPVMLKQMQDGSKLGFPVWDPRVS